MQEKRFLISPPPVYRAWGATETREFFPTYFSCITIQVYFEGMVSGETTAQMGNELTKTVLTLNFLPWPLNISPVMSAKQIKLPAFPVV